MRCVGSGIPSSRRGAEPAHRAVQDRRESKPLPIAIEQPVTLRRESKPWWTSVRDGGDRREPDCRSGNERKAAEEAQAGKGEEAAWENETDQRGGV